MTTHRPIRKNYVSLRLFSPVAAFLAISVVSASAQTTNTNTVTNGGVINVGDTQIITNPVTLISAAITNNGSLQFWQTTALTNSGIISGSGSLTKASGSGNLTLSGSNTFNGKVTVSGGTLTASGVSDTVGSGLGLGTQVELGSGATLQVTVGAGTTNTTTRALIFNGGGTLGASTGTLVWNGNMTNNATSASTIAFNSLAAGTNVFGGVIANTTNNSAVNLNFQNTQIWSLTGSNTFSGGITIGGGKVIADKLANSGTASSIGTAATVRFGYFNNAPSTFEYVGSGSTNNMQVKLGAAAGTGNNVGSFLQNGSGVLVLTNANFTVTSDVQASNMSRVLVLGGTNAADNTISGIIANADTTNANSTVSIVKDGSGKWVLSGANTYSGGTVISNGTLQIGAGGASGSVVGAITNNAALVFNRSDASTATNTISGSGTVTKASGSGNLTLSGSNTFSGKVTVASGTLNATSIADSGASSLGTGTQLELGSGATLAFTATNANSTTRQLVLTGTGDVTLQNSGSGAVVWSGNLVNQTTNASAALDLNGTGAGNNEFAGIISNSTAGTLRLAKQNTGKWILSGANTHTGGTDVNNGTLVALTISNTGAASSLGSGGVIRFGGFTGNAPVLEYAGTGSTNNRQFKLGGGGTANTGGTILNNGSGALVFNNGTFNAVGDALPASSIRALALGGTNAADNAITGVISDNNSSNTVSVVKIDSGKWVFSGSNTYTGGTVISNGTLQIGAGGTSGSVLGAITNNAALIFNRSDNLTQSGAISGIGSVTKEGSGTLTLSASNSYSGGLTLNAGAVRAQSGAAFGSGLVTQSSGSSTLVIDTTQTVTNAMSVYNLSSLQTVTLSGNKTLNNATYDVAASTTTTESGVLSGSGGITKLGTGTLVVTASNSFIGAVAVNAGLLNLNSATGGAAALASSVSVATNATLLVSQSDQVNNAAGVTLSGGTIRTAAGASEVFGDLSVSSASFLDFGTTSYANANNISFGTYTPSALLTINNFDFGSTLVFKNDLSGSITNSSLFAFNNGGIANYSWNSGTSTFTITAIPEPSTYLAAAGLLALLLIPAGRRSLRRLTRD